MDTMYTMDQIFSNMFPMVKGISWDLGTVMIGIFTLGFILIGFDFIKDMLFGRFESSRNRRWADKYLDEAENIREARNTLEKGTAAWDEQDLLYKSFVRKSAKLREKSWWS